MTQHIGIVACSAEGAALCYRTICTDTPSLSDYVACIVDHDLEGMGALMLASAHKLAKIGADFLICPDNTIHQALPYVEPHSPLPWLHIAEVVAAEAVARGFRRLALTGTRSLVDSEVYSEILTARGLAFQRPDPAERDEIDRIIMEELVYGKLPLIIDDTKSSLPTLDSTRLLARAALRRAVNADHGTG
jgi:aspartate racemase